MPKTVARRARTFVCALAIGVLSGACGTRVVERPTAIGQPTGFPTDTKAPSLVAPATAVGNEASAPVPNAATAAPAEASSSAAGGSVRPTDTVTRGSTPGPAGSSTAGTNRPSAEATAAPRSAPNKAPGSAPTPSTTLPPPVANRSPVVVASIGTWSGPAAATLAPNLYGAQLWVRSVNDRGGLNGHPVKLIAFDDAFDPARHRAAVQEAIEQRHAVALLSLGTAVSTDDTVNYVTAKRVPVVGSFGGVNGFYKSPMYFPQQSHFDPMYNSWVQSTAAQFVPLGKRKIGITFCSETPLCSDIAKMYAAKANDLGLQLVYQGQGSIAQPDYTAECLSARNAGAEGMVTILDGNSVNRYTASCARQGYKPTYMLVASVILDRHREDPNLEGAFGVTNVFPWFQSGTAASDEYQRALQSYGKGLGNGVGLATGWAAGKLLEQAAAQLPEPPTSDAILNGLWSVKTDDLGGLTMPLTFVKDQPAKPAVCWWNLQIKKGAWTSPDAYGRHCL